MPSENIHDRIQERLSTIPGWVRRHGPLLGILITYGLLCVLYSATIPLGETPDELAHYQYVRYVDRTGHAPLTAEDRAVSGYKGHEPPLYYLAVHRATSFLHVVQRPMLKLLDPDRYPRHSIGAEVMLWNAVLHTAEETFPWHGTSLAWHLMRLLSIPLGMVTIVCTYDIVCMLFPGRRTLAVCAAGLNAFIPQFVYISSAMNNDNLAVPLSVLSLWVLVRMARGDLCWRWVLMLGVVIGLARITKFYTLILLPIAGFALLLIAWRYRKWVYCLLAGLLVVVLVLGVSAPWVIAVQADIPELAPKGVVGFVAKMLDVVHTDRMLRSQGMSAAGGGLRAFPAMVLSFFRLEPQRWAELLFKSFWAYYGPMTIEADRWVYLLMAALAGVAAAGLLKELVRAIVDAGARRREGAARGHLVPLVIVALQGIAFVLLEALFYTIMRRLPDTAQGRHLFAAMPAWSLFLAWGLLSWIPSRRRAVAASMLVVALAALSLYCLPKYVLAAYDPALPVRRQQIRGWQPEVALSANAAPGIRCLGYSPAESRASAGETINLTLHWQAVEPIGDEYLLGVRCVGPDGESHLLHLSQPVEGRWPTRARDPGDIVHDQYEILLPPVMAPGRYALRFAWLNYQLEELGPELEAGVVVIDRVKASSDQLASPKVVVEGPGGQSIDYRQSATATWRAADVGGGSAQFVSEGSIWRPLVTETYPTVDSELLQRAFFLVTARTVPGRYQLWEQGRSLNRFLTVRARERSFEVPESFAPVCARLGDKVMLWGYRLEGATWSSEPREGLVIPYPTAKPGQTLNLLLAWGALDWIPRNYTVFTHLVDEQGAARAQHDKVPLYNYSTLFWALGEVVVDLYYLSLPMDIPSGVYEVRVGMYERLHNTRLSVRDTQREGDTSVPISSVVVVTR